MGNYNFKFAEEGSVINYNKVIDGSKKVSVSINGERLDVLTSPESKVSLSYYSAGGETFIGAPKGLDTKSENELVKIIEEGLKILQPGGWRFESSSPSVASKVSTRISR